MDDRLHVLIAEDETLIRLDLRQLLEAEGLAVCAEARDGAGGRRPGTSTQPDAAILDMKMPNLDGIEAARRIYAERPIPIVMLTAYADPALVERAIGAGVFASRQAVSLERVVPTFGPRLPGTRSCLSRGASAGRAERRSRSRCVRARGPSTRCAFVAGRTAA